MRRFPVLRDIQTAFAAALQGPDASPLAPALQVPGRDVETRFAIYRETVAASLTDVLAAAFPVVRRILGAAFFDAAAAAFVTARLPERPQLVAYGAGFPDGLAAHSDLHHLPYVADVARLEWARGESYFAADAPALAPALLQALAPAALPEMRLAPHPATRLVRSAFPIQRIWEVNQPEVETVPPVDFSVAETVLVTRRMHRVTARVLSPGDAAFFEALAAGVPLGAAVETATAADGAFALGPVLEAHLRGGTFTG